MSGTMKRALCLLTMAACGAEEGTPIDGTITIEYGGAVITPSVGAAIPDPESPDQIIVVLGTRSVSCETTLERPLPRGTYLVFTIDRGVGPQTPFVSVLRIDSGGAAINGATGEVMLDGVDGRVVGAVTLATEDPEIGPITASGTFDVVDC